MNKHFCRSRWLLPLVAAVLFFAAALFLLPARAQRSGAADRTPASVFDKLFVDGALVDYTDIFLAKRGNVYYIGCEQANYQLACSDRDAAAALGILQASIDGQPYFLQELNGGREYGFDFGLRMGNFTIGISYVTSAGEVATETISVCAMQPYSPETTGSVWYSAEGWILEEGAFTGQNGAGTLTILSGSDRPLEIAAEATHGNVSVTLDGVLQPSGTSFTLPAAEDSVPHVATFFYSGTGCATVTPGKSAVSSEVRLTLSYDALLGDVYDVSGGTPVLLSPQEYTFGEGTALSLLFVPKESVPSSLEENVWVPCALLDFTFNEKTHTGTSFEITMQTDSHLSVRFAETLPDPPSEGTIAVQAADGTFLQRTFADGSAVPVPTDKKVTISLPALLQDADCTVSTGEESHPLEAYEGIYKFTCSVPKTQSRVRFTISLSGFAPTTFDLILRPYSAITPDENSITERIYGTDGAILQDFSLHATVYFTDGTRSQIPLSYSDETSAYIFESVAENPEYLFRTTIPLRFFRSELAVYCEQEAALQDSDNIPLSAAALFESYSALFSGRTEQERLYLAEKLPVGFASQIVTEVILDDVPQNSDRAEAILRHTDGSEQTVTILLSSENFTTEDGVPIATGVYTASFRGVPYYIIWKANVLGGSEPDQPDPPEEKPRVTIVISDATSVYGDPTAPLTYTATGLPENEMLAVQLEKAPGKDVGEYTITGHCEDERYDIVICDGVYTITPRPVTIQIADATGTFGDPTPAFSFTVVSGSLCDDLGITLYAQASESSYTYTIKGTADAQSAKNYTITWIEGSYTVALRPVTLKADDFTLSAYAVWDDVVQSLHYSVTEGTLSEQNPPEIALSVLIGDTVLTEENFELLWKGGTHTIRILAEGTGYDFTTADGTLRVTAATVKIAVPALQYTYSGTPIQPFDWQKHLEGLLPSASAECFAAELFDKDGKQVPAILNAGTYIVRVRIVHSDEYAFISGSQTQFEVNMTKFDISNNIEIIGINDSDTIIIGEKFDIFAKVTGYNVQYNCILEHNDISINFETIGSDDLTEAGVYSVRVIVSDENYCGEKSLSFTLAEGFHAEMQALQTLLEEYASAEASERFALLYRMRETLLTLTEAELEQAMQHEEFAAVFRQCAEAWSAYVQDSKLTLTSVKAATHTFDPTMLLRAAAAFTAAVAVAVVCRKYR